MNGGHNNFAGCPLFSRCSIFVLWRLECQEKMRKTHNNPHGLIYRKGDLHGQKTHDGSIRARKIMYLCGQLFSSAFSTFGYHTVLTYPKIEEPEMILVLSEQPVGPVKLIEVR